MDVIRLHAKALVAVLVVALQLTAGLITDGLTWAESVIIAAGIANAVLVYLVPDLPSMPWLKSATNAVLVALAAIQTYITGHQHIGASQVLLIVLAVLGALGVTVTNNRGDYLDQQGGPV